MTVVCSQHTLESKLMGHKQCTLESDEESDEEINSTYIKVMWENIKHITQNSTHI